MVTRPKGPEEGSDGQDHEINPEAGKGPENSRSRTRTLSRKRRGKQLPTLAQREQRLAYLLLSPPVLIVLGVIILPVAWNIWLSFHRVLLRDLPHLSWFDLNLTLANFTKIFTSYHFWPSLRATLNFSIFGTLFALILGLSAALLVNARFPGRGAVRGFFLLPYIAPVVAIAFAWRFILDPRGVFITELMNLGILDQPVPILSQRPWAMLALIFFEGWRYFPFDFLFILARLQAIPNELYEAAAVDGATPFQRFFHITLPQLRLVLATLVLLRFMWTFNKFDEVYLLTGGSAGTKVLTMKVYDFLMGEWNVGAGAAMALVLFLVLGLFLVVYFRWVMRWAEETSV